MRLRLLLGCAAVLSVGCGVENLEGGEYDETELVDAEAVASEEVATLDQDLGKAWACKGCQKCFDVASSGGPLPCMTWTGGPPEGYIRIETGANAWNSIKLQRCTKASWVQCDFVTVRQTQNYARKSTSIRITRKGPSWWRLCVQKQPGAKFRCSGVYYGKYFEGE